jgi:hypothetical protein
VKQGFPLKRLFTKSDAVVLSCLCTMHGPYLTEAPSFTAAPALSGFPGIRIELIHLFTTQ